MWRKATAAGAAVLVIGLVVATAAGAHGWPDGGSHFPRWTKAEPVGPVNEADSAEGCPFESPDGLSLFFASNRGQEPNDIWVADRTSVNEPWQAPRRLESPINEAGFGDFCPTPVRGRSLMFVSTRGGAGSCGDGDMYISRQSPAGGWSEPVNLGCDHEGGPNTPGGERSPSLVETPYGTFLFYSTNGTSDHQDIRVSRMRKDGTFGRGKIIKALSTPSQDLMPNVRERESGGFEMVFSSDRPASRSSGKVWNAVRMRRRVRIRSRVGMSTVRRPFCQLATAIDSCAGRAHRSAVSASMLAAVSPSGLMIRSVTASS